MDPIRMDKNQGPPEKTPERWLSNGMDSVYGG